MSDKYILDKEGNPVPEPNLLAWGRWCDNINNRVIAKTKIKDVTVSTVFLGLDHSFSSNPGHKPILFETMIFGGEHDSWQDRYATKEEAQKGHAAVVEKLKNGEPLHE